MISSWCIYRARRTDMQMHCLDAQITVKEKMKTNNLWYYHPSSLVKYLPAWWEVKKQTQVIKKNGHTTRMELTQGNFNQCKIRLKRINKKTKKARKGLKNEPIPTN